MQIVVNKDFSILAVEPSNVYQGSSNASSLSIFAPFSVSAYASVLLYFELPNGEVLKPYVAFATEQMPNGIGLWSTLLDGNITKYAGEVKCQLEFVGATTVGGESAPINARTDTFTINVLEGIAPELPETPSQDIYNQILEGISYLATTFAGLIDAEASDRRSADEALGTRITNEENARSSAVSELDGKISAEKSAREAADTSIREAVATNKSSIDILNGGNSTEGSVKKQIADAIAAIMENPDTLMSSIQELDGKISAEKSAREAADTSIREAVATNKSSIDILNGGTSTEGSVKKQIADAIAAIMENPDTSMNSIQELVDWVNNHASDALALSNKASANETAIGNINALLGTSLPATTNASTVIGYITEIANKLATETSERTAADTQLQNNIDAEASIRSTDINEIRENAVFGVELSGQDLVFRDKYGVELQDNRITLPLSSGGGSSPLYMHTVDIEYDNSSEYIYASLMFLSKSPNYVIIGLDDLARYIGEYSGFTCSGSIKTSAGTYPITDITMSYDDGYSGYYIQFGYRGSSIVSALGFYVGEEDAFYEYIQGVV